MKTININGKDFTVEELNKNLKIMKFTQEIKDAWLKALKSGDYTQGYTELEYKREDDKRVHCCIGVLGKIVEGLDNSLTNGGCPYTFLQNNIGESTTVKLWETNDKMRTSSVSREKDYKDDYSNVIPLIEALKVTV